MQRSQIVITSAGPVEVSYRPGPKPPVLVFPGGHASAATPLGQHLYRELGYGVVCVSRPGYGRTNVGPLSAAEFTSIAIETCQQVGVNQVSAAVGVSFGGLAAIHTAVAAPEFVLKLILHSCAPSVLAYPDRWIQRVTAPLVFGPATQKITWTVIRRLVASDAGLKIMMSSLAAQPAAQWWPQMSPADRAQARATFIAMDSGTGFRRDVAQASGRLSCYRAHLHSLVRVPTLITASRQDGAVPWRHAQNFAATITGARLVETTSPTHFFWIGPAATELTAAVQRFLTAP